MKYSKINIKQIFYFFIILTIIGGSLIYIFKQENDATLLNNFLLAFVPAVTVVVVSKIMKTPFLVPKLGFVVPKDVKGDIRISYSSLIRIKFMGYYLLTKGNYNRYQPPGGVFHYKGDYIEKKFGFARDNTGSDPCDIRGTINIDNLKPFMSWINEKENREVSPDREFDEELIKTKILDDRIFHSGDLVFDGRKFKDGGIAYSKHNKKNELIIFDIYDYNMGTKQKEILKSMIDKESENYIFADAESILREGVDGKSSVAVISDHAKYILEENNNAT